MKRLNFEEEIAVAEQLATMPTETTRTMHNTDRVNGILQMLRDLDRLAWVDGCVAAGWALEFAATMAVLQNIEKLGHLIPHQWSVYQMNDMEWWAGPSYAAAVYEHKDATGCDADEDDGEPVELEQFRFGFQEIGMTPERELLEIYLSGKPNVFATNDY